MRSEAGSEVSNRPAQNGQSNPGQPSAYRDQRFAFSPDGETLAFLRHGESRSAILLLPVCGGEPSMIHHQSGWIGHLAWVADGQRLVFTSDHEGGSKLFQIAAARGTPEPLPFAEDSAYSPAIAVRGNLLAQESPDGRTLYYSWNSGGIWKMPVDGGEETAVIPAFTGELRGYWRVVEDGIYYLNKNSEPGPALEFFVFATRRSQRIAVLTGNYSVYHGGLTVSPDRRWIVYSQTSRTSNEIMLVENFR